MSLKVVHIVFVVSAILMSLAVGGIQLLSFRQSGGVGTLFFGLGWLAAGGLLTVYGRQVVRKLRSLSCR